MSDCLGELLGKLRSHGTRGDPRFRDVSGGMEVRYEDSGTTTTAGGGGVGTATAAVAVLAALRRFIGRADNAIFHETTGRGGNNERPKRIYSVSSETNNRDELQPRGPVGRCHNPRGVCGSGE